MHTHVGVSLKCALTGCAQRMVHTLPRVVGVHEAEAAVGVLLQPDGAGPGAVHGTVQHAPVVAAWTERAHHDDKLAASGDAELLRRVERAQKMVDVGEVHVDQVLDVTVHALASFHDFDGDSRAQRGIELRVRAPAADEHAAFFSQGLISVAV